MIPEIQIQRKRPHAVQSKPRIIFRLPMGYRLTACLPRPQSQTIRISSAHYSLVHAPALANLAVALDVVTVPRHRRRALPGHPGGVLAVVRNCRRDM